MLSTRSWFARTSRGALHWQQSLRPARVDGSRHSVEVRSMPRASLVSVFVTMPFALPEYDRAFSAFVSETVHELARARDPVLAEMHFATVPTTVGSRVRDREGLDVDLEPENVGFEMSTSVTAVRAADYDEFCIEVDQAADMLARDLMRVWVGTMHKITEATGNVVDAGGKLTFEVVYEMLDKIEYSLDENDELIMPSLVMHPDTAKQLEALGPPSPEQNAMLAELRERKRGEALARRRRRRLP